MNLFSCLLAELRFNEFFIFYNLSFIKGPACHTSAYLIKGHTQYTRVIRQWWPLFTVNH